MTLEDRLLIANAVDVAELIDRVCKHFGVTRAQLIGRDRHAHVAQARQVAAWLLRQRGFSYPAIGQELKQDHTTVMYSVRKVERLRSENARVAEVIEKMKGTVAA